MGRKRSATPDIEGNEEQVKGTGKAARKIVKGEIKAKRVDYADIAALQGAKRDGCALLTRMPAEVMDKFLADDTLTLRDPSRAPAASFESFTPKTSFKRSSARAEVPAIINVSSRGRSASLILSTLLSNALRKQRLVRPACRNPLGAYSEQYYQLVMADVMCYNMSKSDARSKYKVTEAEIKSLPCDIRGGYIGETHFFRESSVQALAYRSHGGPLGHAAHLDKLKAIADKGKATRIPNGTVKVAKPKKRSYYQILQDEAAARLEAAVAAAAASYPPVMLTGGTTD